MGELAVARTPGEVLASVGLGSCIGLALVSRSRPLAGLAHVMLPESGAGTAGDPGKYADTAVPALVRALERLGARVAELDAVLVGGAHMFSFGGASLDIGARNEAAVRGALELLRLPVLAAATGAAKGRTIRVHVATSLVLVKEAGGADERLYAARADVEEAA